jgi:hypothetical protein
MMKWEQMAGIVRHVLTFAGGYLVVGGYMGEADLATAVGAVVTIVGLVWSYVEKKDA